MSLIDECKAWYVNGEKVFLRVLAQLDPDFIDLLVGKFLSKEPLITIKSEASAGAKQSHVFANGTKQFLIRCEKVVEIKYNFDETDYDNGIKATITSGGFLQQTGLTLEDKTIYFNTQTGNRDVEILEWS